MTEFELTFAYKIEGMLSRIAHPEYRQLLVELLCIIATILERNHEIMFMSGPLDCDVMIKKAFHLYADQKKIANREDLTPFYQLENLSLQTSTATYLARFEVESGMFQAVVEYILNGRHFSSAMNIFASEGLSERDDCKMM
uniref:Phosphorylase b kinase regulatory subunit n=1 Tax=Angiostrongylus cantonensis TaxID=6313 RepID=A0A0K0CZ47_ANGCA